jgi:hypothetical protein
MTFMSEEDGESAESRPSPQEGAEGTSAQKPLVAIPKPDPKLRQYVEKVLPSDTDKKSD